jgi:hypothetical protein
LEPSGDRFLVWAFTIQIADTAFFRGWKREMTGDWGFIVCETEARTTNKYVIKAEVGGS